jgi:hypothetical protein
MSSIIIPCDCGSEMIKVTDISDENDVEKTYAIVVYFLPYRRMKKWKLIWNIIRGRVHCLYELILTEKYMNKLSTAIRMELINK